MLTGALVGAQVGLEGIPRRFITGLRDAQCYLALAAELEQWAIRQENALTQDGGRGMAGPSENQSLATEKARKRASVASPGDNDRVHTIGATLSRKPPDPVSRSM